MNFNFWNSTHRWTYIRIAICHFTTPSHVYDVAHHLFANYKDMGIVRDLH